MISVVSNSCSFLFLSSCLIFSFLRSLDRDLDLEHHRVEELSFKTCPDSYLLIFFDLPQSNQTKLSKLLLDSINAHTADIIFIIVSLFSLIRNSSGSEKIWLSSIHW
jgi:hypothetical protein